MDNTTLLKLIIIEFKKMVAGKIHFAPKPEQIQSTAQVWFETIYDEFPKPDQIEIPRIQEAFSTLRKTCNQWPTASDLLKALPPYSRQYHLAGPLPTKEECERGKAAIKNIMENVLGDDENETNI